MQTTEKKQLPPSPKTSIPIQDQIQDKSNDYDYADIDLDPFAAPLSKIKVQPVKRLQSFFVSKIPPRKPRISVDDGRTSAADREDPIPIAVPEPIVRKRLKVYLHFH